MTSSSSNTVSSHSFVDTCETFAVDSRLLYNDIEQLSNKRFRHTRHLANWSRILALAAVAAAGVAGLSSYYQRAQIHRVWRIRHPRRVRQLSLLTMVSGGFSLCTVLFLISPLGLMRLHEKEVQRTHQLDAIAVAALVQEQNFRTLAAWGGGRRSGMEGQTTQGDGQQWVWKEVVVDVAPLLSCHQAGNDAQTDGEAEAASAAAAVAVAAVPATAADTLEKTDAGVAEAKKSLEAELLLPSVKTELAMLRAPRRVWTRTEDAASLQTILEAAVDTWETLVAEKTDIVARVL